MQHPDIGDVGDERFRHAVRRVLAHEGGFVDDPDDPGDATKHGISLRYLRRLGDLDGDGYLDGDLDQDGDLDVEDIRRMTPATAARIYHDQWWQRYGYGELRVGTATKVFDLAVNMGPRQAHICLQRAARAAFDAELVEDGILGPNTRAAVAAGDEDRLLAALKSEAAGYYRSLIAARPALAKYERGWLRRAYA